MTYSFPCTDLSVAGKMKGMSKEDWESGNSTRSGLLWEVERILKEMNKEELPDILLMENVPQVHADKNAIDFESWLKFLRGKGYQNYYQDLNAKDYGIPQNRDRTFCVSILSDEYLEFEFPEPIQLNYAMRDFLESEVEEKYYVNSEKAKELISKLIIDGTLPTEGGGYLNYQQIEKTGVEVAKTLCARDYKGYGTGWDTMNGVFQKKNDQLNYVGNIRGGQTPQGYSGSVYQKDGLAPTVLARDYKEPILIISR